MSNSAACEPAADETVNKATVPTNKRIPDFPFTPDSRTVSIFDFDGTLFRSPAPTPKAEKSFPTLTQPYENKGLAWYQNTRSLDPPYVPAVVGGIATSTALTRGGTNKAAVVAAAAALTALIQWPPGAAQQQQQTLQHLAPAVVDAVKLHDAALAALLPHGGADTEVSAAAMKPRDLSRGFQQAFDQMQLGLVVPATSKSLAATAVLPTTPPLPPDSFDRWFITPTVAAYVAAKARGDVTAILTGREAKRFTPRVNALLEAAEMPFDHVHLKQGKGTIHFKIDTIMHYIETYRPQKVIYYEDRADQARKIEWGVATAVMGAFGNPYDYPEQWYRDYIRSYVFEIVMVPPQWAESFLHSAEEEQLIQELLKDRELLMAGSAGEGGGGRGGAPAAREVNGPRSKGKRPAA